jgi:hypothetical protein
VREKTIGQYLRDRVRAIGGRAYKLNSPGNDGMPDRLVCIPNNVAVFVETKAPGKTSTPKQRLQQQRLREMGFVVFAEIDNKEKVDHVIHDIEWIVTHK